MNPEDNQPLQGEPIDDAKQIEDDEEQNWDDSPELPEIEVKFDEDPQPQKTDPAPTPDWWETSPTPLETVSPPQEEILTTSVLEEEVKDLKTEKETSALEEEVKDLKTENETLKEEIKALLAQKEELLTPSSPEIESQVKQLITEGLKEFEQRKQALEIEVERLERRRERIREEMRTTFAGASQELAIRVQGFKEFLVGSLQDLVTAADQLELAPSEDNWETSPSPSTYERSEESASPSFAQSKFKDQIRRIQEILDQYRTRPDYYGPPWQLRRTFEPIHAERVQNWFFSQGGRGAIRSMGSRLQNILVASAVTSVVHQLYGDRSRVLILVNAPEQLGEWRRGLQDCLGISRSDFAPERGIGLFESPDALVQKADRLIEDNKVPLVIIDEAEEEINLGLLQFPLWLAYAPDPQQMSSYYY
ncbi:MAG: DUF3086 domain-containing protein [Microcystaceae cyanobacterium]